MESPQIDIFQNYDNLTIILRKYAQDYPSLVKLHIIGHSHENRIIWLVSITNTATGSPEEKPALWIDANIHAPELSGSAVALHFIDYLIKNYQLDPRVTNCLDTRAFYIVPRANPDGAELALMCPPKIVRSGTKPYPDSYKSKSGLIIEDIDGDGRILMMRIPDPNGAWKICPQEPRLLIRREPGEEGGSYFRLFREGRIENYDETTITLMPDTSMLDFNRNFPDQWRPEDQQPGAGEYPASEPEVRAIVNFITSHKNIFGSVSLHTHSGVFLRPFNDKSDEKMQAEDLQVYQTMGKYATKITGYPAVSTFHGFRYYAQDVMSGTFPGWCYEEQGIFSWIIEIWNPWETAGIQNYQFIKWDLDHPVEDDIQMLRWSDQYLGGNGYIDWYPFEHPQLGMVELGGLDRFLWYSNPPKEFRKSEFEKFAPWFLWFLSLSPKLELHLANVTSMGNGFFKVRVIVNNSGWLPTYVTKIEKNKSTTRGVVFEICLPEDAFVSIGDYRVQRDHLEGRAYTPAAFSAWRTSDVTNHRVKQEWLVYAPKGGEALINVWADKAGSLQVKLSLPIKE